MVSVLQLLAALIPRTLFLGHGIFCVWLVVQFNSGQTIYYSMCVGLCCLMMEMLFTLLVRKGAEYKYFWPSCFFYLCTLIPATWQVEMDLLEDRLKNNTQIARVKMPGSETFITEEDTKNICEIGMMILIIAGRWMLPRGLITRDQLSTLLLEYVAIAADILELFQVFDEETVARNREVTMAILAVYSWSLLQFTIVFTDTNDPEEDENEYKDAEKQKKKWNDQMASMENDPKMPRRKYLRKLKLKEAQKQKKKHRSTYDVAAEESNDKMKKMQLQGNVYGILAAIFSQDGPFLVVRLLLMAKYNIQGEMLPFWAGKNAVALLLLFYRLYVIQFKSIEEKEPLQRFREASFAVLSTKFLEARKQTIQTYKAPGVGLGI